MNVKSLLKGQHLVYRHRCTLMFVPHQILAESALLNIVISLLCPKILDTIETFTNCLKVFQLLYSLVCCPSYPCRTAHALSAVLPTFNFNILCKSISPRNVCRLIFFCYILDIPAFNLHIFVSWGIEMIPSFDAIINMMQFYSSSCWAT